MFTAFSILKYVLMFNLNWLFLRDLLKSYISLPIYFCCCCSVAKSCPALCNPMNRSTAGFPVLHHLLEHAWSHIQWFGDAIQPSPPLSSPSPAFSLSQHQSLFQWVSSYHQVSKYWSFIFSISPSNEYSGLTFFRIDWFDLLAVQGTLKSLLQYHSWKA